MKMNTRKFTISLVIFFFILCLTSVGVMGADRDHPSAQDNESAGLAEEIAQTELTEADLIRLRGQIEAEALAYLREELGLSSVEHTIEVSRVLIGGD